MAQDASPIGLVAPTGGLATLKAAVEAGADTAYLSLKNATNTRNFAGLSFTGSDIRAGVEFAYREGRQIPFTISTFPQPDRTIE